MAFTWDCREGFGHDDLTVESYARVWTVFHRDKRSNFLDHAPETPVVEIACRQHRGQQDIWETAKAT